MPFPPDWIVPDWPAPERVRAVFTTRAGGVSLPPFDGFNLGDHVRDDPVAVARNRASLSQLLGARPVFLHQVHGSHVVNLSAETGHGTQADACVAALPGHACTVMVADCLPVLFAHRSALVVAAAHAGWRGLAGMGETGAVAKQGVLESAFCAFSEAVTQLVGPQSAAEVAAQTLVWLGPCIGPQAFEVGPEVLEAFSLHQPGSAALFKPRQAPGGTAVRKYHADLPALARQRLAAMGLHSVYGNNGNPGWCTVTASSRFFSHRRDAVRLGSSGRMAACVWIA